MVEEPDPARLDALEARLARVRRATPAVRSQTGQAFSQGEMAWRMIIELVSGMLIGLGIGFGLDWLLGTRPWMLIVFVLLGLAAGVKTMLRTAQSMTVVPENDSAAKAAGDGNGHG